MGTLILLYLLKILIFPFKLIFYIIPKWIYCLITKKSYSTGAKKGGAPKLRRKKDLVYLKSEDKLEQKEVDDEIVEDEIEEEVEETDEEVNDEEDESDEDEEFDDSESKTHTKPLKHTKGGITFDDIAGLEDAKEAFKEKVVLPFKHPEIYKRYGKKAGGGILLYGLPGTGKTMFAEAASNLLNAKFFSIRCSDIKSKWYGESEQKVKNIFRDARAAKRAIIFFDEFEAIGAKRTDNADNPDNGLVPEILAQMQGVGTGNSGSTVVVIAATNKPWAIDSAFLRPGRFDEKVYIPLPDDEARRKMFENYLKSSPTKDLDYKYLSEITDGFNGADIKEVCEKLKMKAINKAIKDKTVHPITMEDVHAIEGKIKTSVSTEDIEQLEKFEDSF